MKLTLEYVLIKSIKYQEYECNIVCIMYINNIVFIYIYYFLVSIYITKYNKYKVYFIVVIMFIESVYINYIKS